MYRIFFSGVCPTTKKITTYQFSNHFRVYGFYDECKRKYSTRLWKRFVDVFNCLPAGNDVIPLTIIEFIFFSIELLIKYHIQKFDNTMRHILAAIIEDAIFCVHGGLSPDSYNPELVILFEPTKLDVQITITIYSEHYFNKISDRKY